MQVLDSDLWRMQLFKYLFSLSGNTFVFSPLGSRRPLQQSRRRPVLTLHSNKMLAGNRLQSPQYIHQSGWIGVSVLEFKNQMTAITHSW